MHRNAQTNQNRAADTQPPYVFASERSCSSMAVTVLSVLMILLLSPLVPSSFADEAVLPPDAPWPGDPDLSSFDDPFLKDIYERTMTGIRTAAVQSADPEANARALADFRAAPKPAEEVEHIVAAALDAVESQQWNRYRAALWSTQAGVGLEPRLVALSREMLQAPRGEKVSDAHGLAMIDTLAFLGRSPSESAADILVEATTSDFWGSDPLRSRMLRKETEHSVTMLRTQAIANLGRLPSSISLPRLEKLAEKYPDISAESVPSDDYRFEMGAGYTIAEQIYNVKEREGIPGARHPFVELHGEPSEPLEEPSI